MATPFVGQLMLFPYNFVPRGWVQCAGQLLPVNQYSTLFSLILNTYGGDGVTNFALPDLRGRAALGSGPIFVRGQMGGEEVHTLTAQEVPSHSHILQATTAAATLPKPLNNLLGTSTPSIYVQQLPNTSQTLASGTVAVAGQSLPHENRTPYLAITWCIALTGIFPSRN